MMTKLTWQDVADDAILVGGFAIFLSLVVKEFSGDEIRNLVFLFGWTLANRLGRRKTAAPLPPPNHDPLPNDGPPPRE